MAKPTADSNNLVSGRVRELRGGEADLAVRDVEHVVEPLEEGEAVDEVQALAAVRAEVARDEVDGAVIAANGSVELHETCRYQRKRFACHSMEGRRTARGQIWALGVSS